MRLLVDSCISNKVCEVLAAYDHDVRWAGTWESDPGDDVILKIAFEEKRVVITIDKDFGTLAVLRKIPHSGIIRLVNFSLQQQAAVCQNILSEYQDELLNNAIITVERDRVRIRTTHFDDD